MDVLEVTLAGTVSLRRSDRVLGDEAFAGRQLRLVTAMMVLERANPVTVDALAAQLWPTSPPQQWRVAVRNLVSKLRRSLVDLGLEPEVIVGTTGAYEVDLHEVVVDVEVADRQAAAADEHLAAGRVIEAKDAANRARAVLSRPVLPRVSSDWLDAVRDRTDRRHLDSLVVLGTCRRRLGEHVQARSVLAQAVKLAPLREDAWREVMRNELDAGNAAEALQAYERCRRLLVDELGVDPSTETQTLHGEILGTIPVPPPASTPVTASGPGAGAPAPRTTPSPAEELEPYVGLRPFRRGDADRYFGRDEEVQALVEQVGRTGIVAVVGPSGVGKSSLVRAGLLPALEHGAIPDSDTWPATVVQPGSTPMKAMWTALAELSTGPPDGLDGRLPPGPDALHDLVSEVLHDRPTTSRVLLVIDQLEELFTLGGDEDAAPLVGHLVAATRRLDSRLAVVVTLRADFYGRAAAVPGLADVLNRCQYLVAPLSGEQVEEVVTGPARLVGCSLEAGLLARILTDVAGEPGSLPLLQHLLHELWQQRTDRVLTRGAYHDLGGVAGALANRAESVYAEFDRAQRTVARRVLLRAVQPAEDGADTRRPVRDRELVGLGDADLLESVVTPMVDARLLTAGSDPSKDERVVELAHEALVDGWPRLRAWVDEGRGWLLDHRRLATAAVEWERHGRHDDWLLAGRPLDEANGLVLANGRGEVDLHLSPTEHDLVGASVVARERDRDEEAARLEHERALERRSTNRARALVAVVSVVALVAGGLWWTTRREARLARAGELATASRSIVADDPELALLLALQAHRHLLSDDDAVANDVASAFHAALAQHRLLTHHPDVDGVLAQCPDCGTIATARSEPEDDGTWAVDLRRLDTGVVVRTLHGHEGPVPVSSGAYGPDGTLLAVASGDGLVHRWDPATGQQVGPPLDGRTGDGQGATVTALTHDPTNRYLAATVRRGRPRGPVVGRGDRDARRARCPRGASGGGRGLVRPAECLVRTRWQPARRRVPRRGDGADRADPGRDRRGGADRVP